MYDRLPQAPPASRFVREQRDDDVPYIIDNHEGSPSLAEALGLLLGRSDWADIATGYLSLGGYRLLRDGLARLQELRLLLGESTIQAELQRELRAQRYTAATRALVADLVDFLRREQVHVRRYAGPFFHAKAYILPEAAIVARPTLPITV